jgi:NAD(P)-dependent dehydrogenase (short-subunit alcohol dehydrogenase family)
LVTGGGRGIGREICERFAEEGAAVAVIDVDAEGCEAVARALHDRGCRALGLRADVTEHDRAKWVVERVTAEFGQIDILVNNAGIARHQPLDAMPERDWDEVVATNAKACFNYSQAVLAQMKERRSGRIVNIVSRAILGHARETNYSASKAAVVGFSRALALEVAPFGVTVNCVSPSMVDTPWTRAYPAEVRERAIRLIPMGRIGRPRDIADAVLFFASDEAGYVTGQVLNVCGGRSVGITPW